MPKNGILIFFIGVGVLALIGAVLGLVVVSSSDSDADEAVSAKVQATASRPAAEEPVAVTPSDTGSGKTAQTVAEEAESSGADSVVRKAETGNVQDHAAALIEESKAIDRSPAAVEVAPDPNFAQELSFYVGNWDTDFSLHTIPYSEITLGA